MLHDEASRHEGVAVLGVGAHGLGVLGVVAAFAGEICEGEVVPTNVLKTMSRLANVHTPGGEKETGD